jgi:hypothetical protein
MLPEVKKQCIGIKKFRTFFSFPAALSATIPVAIIIAGIMKYLVLIRDT